MNEALRDRSIDSIAALIKKQEVSLHVLFERVARERISGEVTYCEGFDFVSDLISVLHWDRCFDPKFSRSARAKSGILDYQSRIGKRRHLTFPPFLPDDNDRVNCFALPDAALRLGYTVSPKAGSMFPQPGVQDVVFTLSKVCAGRCLLGVLWGTDDEPTLIDRFGFSDLEIVESPVLRNETNYFGLRT